MNKDKIAEIRALLESYMNTIDADITTGGPVDTKHVSRGSYLAKFEVEKIMQVIED